MDCSLPALLFATRHSLFADVTLRRMRLCRFGDHRLGLVRGDAVADVTAALEALPAHRYPLPRHDPLIAHLSALRAGIAAAAERARADSPATVHPLSPVAHSGK